ncbi:unnamed protein product [Cuscuta epithymum]|uniref:MULE transposase domain-containing protein n=1 Tax=Cuscuta epithymum TaxID=186058 RepID=A0AAV0CZK4_9ASTE|nr:unnamed protein product [Cuscuta epithymum]
MKAYYKGTLLTACAQDANNHIIPLAFEICDFETKASWLWFLSRLSGSISMRSDMYIVYDRHKGLISAAAEVFPHALHGFCVEHLRRNLISKFRSGANGLGWKFKAAYSANTMQELEEYLSMLDTEDARIRPWLSKVGNHR